MESRKTFRIDAILTFMVINEKMEDRYGLHLDSMLKIVLYYWL